MTKRKMDRITIIGHGVSSSVVERIRTTYPSAEVIVVDDASKVNADVLQASRRFGKTEIAVKYAYEGILESIETSTKSAKVLVDQIKADNRKQMDLRSRHFNRYRK